jgi:1-pyrroline-5-carboxylate dehydrogenase
MAHETFKLTYATMFSPPEELHTRFDEALAELKQNLGQEHAMIIGGKERFADQKFEDRSPADTDVVLGIFQKGTPQDAHDAIEAAKKPFPVWSRMPWQERVALVRKAAEVIDRRTLRSVCSRSDGSG